MLAGLQAIGEWSMRPQNLIPPKEVYVRTNNHRPSRDRRNVRCDHQTSRRRYQTSI